MSDDVSLDHLGKLARAALKEWSIENATLELVKHRENAVYSVTTANGRYALRVHRGGYHTDDELRSELQWMKALNEYGLNTPGIVPAKNGDLFKVVKTSDVPAGRQCDLLAWADGEQLGSIEGNDNPEPETLESSFEIVGRLMARMHNQSSEWLLPDNFTRHAWDIEGITGENPFWGRFWELEALTPAQRDLLTAASEIVSHRLKQFGRESDRYGLIHADFVPENLLANGEEINIIDFDDAGFGWYLFDVVTSVFWFLGEDHFDDYLQALIRGYRSERDLPDEHLEMLPTFFMARGLTYVSWLHTRRETQTAREMGPLVIEGVCALAEDFCS